MLNTSSISQTEYHCEKGNNLPWKLEFLRIFLTAFMTWIPCFELLKGLCFNSIIVTCIGIDFMMNFCLFEITINFQLLFTCNWGKLFPQFISWSNVNKYWYFPPLGLYKNCTRDDLMNSIETLLLNRPLEIFNFFVKYFSKGMYQESILFMLFPSCSEILSSKLSIALRLSKENRYVE